MRYLALALTILMVGCDTSVNSLDETPADQTPAAFTFNIKDLEGKYESDPGAVEDRVNGGILTVVTDTMTLWIEGDSVFTRSATAYNPHGSFADGASTPNLYRGKVHPPDPTRNGGKTSIALVMNSPFQDYCVIVPEVYFKTDLLILSCDKGTGYYHRKQTK